MWVCGSGWNELVIATPSVKSSPRRRACRRPTEAPRIASELVRVSSPSRGESPGSAPAARISCSSRWVPSAPAANTTWSAWITWRCRRSQAPVRSVCTAYPPPVAGLTAVTVVSGCTWTPSRSASQR